MSRKDVRDPGTRTGNREMDLVHGLDLMGAGGWSESSKLFAFVSIFHPHLSLEKRLRLAWDIKLKEERGEGRGRAW